MGLIFDEPRAEERKDHKQQREERLDRMLQDILKPRSARTDGERRRLPELRLQLIDAERAIETLMVVLANESREDVASYYGAHDRKLASKGYTREHDHGGDAA